MADERRAYLSLGSNLGDREGNLRACIERIDALPGTRVLDYSSLLETPPWGVTDQPPFLNMAAVIATTLPPEDLLFAFKDIEAALGRKVGEKWGPRTADIDLLVYEGETRDTPTLTLPHPYVTERRFVLQPLEEIAPELIVKGKTIREWLEATTDAV
jgi:2-amino-4-hydroxy-6-hydroxymethyldihydropteridine diphosphokinase